MKYSYTMDYVAISWQDCEQQKRYNNNYNDDDCDNDGNNCNWM